MIRAHTNIEFIQDAVSFWLVDESNGERRAFAAPVQMKAREQENLMVEPTFRLQTAAAQEMFEQLWAQGFRSKHDKGNAEALDAARREHIGDLRKAARWNQRLVSTLSA
jgi:hypothetical protein